MATTYTTRVGLGYPALDDRNWHVPLIATIQSLDLINAIGAGCVVPTEYPSASLNVAVAAVTYRTASGAVQTYAGTSSVAITTATTKYLYLDASNTLQVGSAWPTTGYYVPLAVVVAGTSTITSITDARQPLAAVNAGPTSGTATLVAGTVTVSTTAVAASSKIEMTRQTAGGTLGHLSIGTITAGTSLVINSSSNTDTSTIYWRIME